MFDVKSLDGSLWLAEPVALRRLVARVLRVPTCPAARDLAKARRKRLEVARNAAAAAVRSTKGKVGVIPVYGPVQQRRSAEMEKADGTSLQEVSAAFDALVADPSVTAIVLDVDSPGGSSYGVEELSDKIYAARARKPSYAVANSMACSAAYWVATAASHLSVTPGGDVGSVGVYALHVDESKANELEGVSVEIVSAGKYKAEFAPTGPLTDAAREHLQEQVDATYGKFVAAVARNRGCSVADVRANFGQGRVVNADQAVRAKMVDKVAPFEDVLGKLTGGGSVGGRRASADVLRWRQEQRLRVEA